MRSYPSFALSILLLTPVALGIACSEGSAPREADGSLPTGPGGGELPAIVVAIPAPGGPAESFALPSDDAGSVAPESNPLGIRGAWSTRLGTNSTLELRAEAGAICFRGAAAQIVGEVGEQFGAAAVLDLCRPDAEQAGFTLGDCPDAAGLHESLVGVGFSVDGMLPPFMRTGFRELERMDTPYVVVRQAGEVVALFEDALVRNNPEAEFSHPDRVTSLEFLVPASRQAARPFDFCVRDLAALTGRGWVSKEVPAWALEPGPGQQVEWVGVNLAGAEFGQQNLPGTYPVDYQYPSAGDIDAFAARGMNLIRLPFRWERLQPSLGQDFDAAELGRLSETVSYATGLGLTLLLDPHNYARYIQGGVESVLGDGVEIAQFADFWRRLAENFGADPKVAFGLVNEPHDMLTETWLEAANAAIAAIRGAGAMNLVLVPGNGWTGAHSWTASYYGTANATVMTGVIDPANNFVYELHQYLDADSSGTGATCLTEGIGPGRMQEVTDWLRSNGRRGLLAEFGAPPNDLCFRAVDRLLSFVSENADVWLGWAAWAAGPRWGDYAMSVQPLPNGKDRPPMAILHRHIADGLGAVPEP